MKSWRDKLAENKQAVKKHIEKGFAGMPAGCLMYISTPQEIDHCVRQLKSGEFIDNQHLRAILASRNGAEYTCPVTTGMFLRIVAEAAFEKFNKQGDMTGITPFWRAVTPGTPLARKLACGQPFIAAQRAAEQGV